MAQLRLEQLHERDRLYEILDETVYEEYKDEYGYTYQVPELKSRFKDKKPNEVIEGVPRTKEALEFAIRRAKDMVERNILQTEWNSAYHPELSSVTGYSRINSDLSKRRLRRPNITMNFIRSQNFPSNKGDESSRTVASWYKTEKALQTIKDEIAYLELVYIELFLPKQLAITATVKEKLQKETITENLELQKLETQLGIAQKELKQEALEVIEKEMTVQESQYEVLTFNKLIDKVQELHAPEVKTDEGLIGFNLESIDAKKLLIVGAGLVTVLIIIVLVRKK